MVLNSLLQLDSWLQTKFFKDGRVQFLFRSGLITQSEAQLGLTTNPSDIDGKLLHFNHSKDPKPEKLVLSVEIGQFPIFKTANVSISSKARISFVN